MTKVLIVDDSSFMRVKIRTHLESDPNIKVIGIARNGLDAINKTISLKPDVITMDINMPDMSGIMAVEEIMQKCPTPIIMISSLTYQGSLETLEALEKGAVDYIHKDELEDDLLIEKVQMAKKAALYSSAPEPVEPTQPTTISKSISIIGIGISTGGPKALSQFIPEISPDISASIIIAQHMPPAFTNSLAERLDIKSKITVKEAENGESLYPGYAYICPGGMHITVEKAGFISLHPKENFPQHFYSPSADLLMSSIAKTYGTKALCLIMTGMGSDGLEGVKIAKKYGSYIMAQSEKSSTIYGMPKVIVSNNLQDEIIELNNIGQRINQITNETLSNLPLSAKRKYY